MTYEPHIGICDTCGAENVELYVYALPGIPMTVGNCQVCFQLSCYPFNILVANTAAIGGIEHAADWWKYEVRVSLARHGKTFNEFDDEVRASIKGMMEEQEA